MLTKPMLLHCVICAAITSEQLQPKQHFILYDPGEPVSEKNIHSLTHSLLRLYAASLI